MKKILYVGPSWAVKSWNSITDNVNETNLNKLLNLKGIDLSQPGISNLDVLSKINKYYDDYDAIFWIYCEPILDLEKLKICTKSQFIESENFLTLRSWANREILDKISNLNKNIAILGAHSDIFDCHHKNITIIHNSWQKYLDSLYNSNYPEDEKLIEGWGAEVAHRWIFDYTNKDSLKYNKNIKPSYSIVEKIDQTFFNWSLLQEQGMWYEVHPTRKGNESFAKHITSKVKNWLNNI